jgi:hypothetical protein
MAGDGTADYFLGAPPALPGRWGGLGAFLGKSPLLGFRSRSRKGAGWVWGTILAQLETLPRSAPLADNFRRLKVEDPCVLDLAT